MIAAAGLPEPYAGHVMWMVVEWKFLQQNNVINISLYFHNCSLKRRRLLHIDLTEIVNNTQIVDIIDIPAAKDADTLRRARCKALGGRKSTASRLYATSRRSCAMRAVLQMSRLDNSTRRPPRFRVDNDAATNPG